MKMGAWPPKGSHLENPAGHPLLVLVLVVVIRRFFVKDDDEHDVNDVYYDRLS